MSSPSLDLVFRRARAEDERPIREMIAFGLKRAGFEVREAEDCRAARIAVADSRPDLLLVDWMLPDMSGLELTRSLKRDRDTRDLPIIMLTARAEEGDKIAGLDGGADDYLTKPFAFAELTARLRALVRRGPRERPAVLRVGSLSLDPATRRVWRGDTEISLSAKEYLLLETFMRSPDEVLTRLQLLERAWDYEYENRSNVVDVYVRYLREKIDRPFGVESIQTLRGAGYRLRSAG